MNVKTFLLALLLLLAVAGCNGNGAADVPAAPGDNGDDRPTSDEPTDQPDPTGGDDLSGAPAGGDEAEIYAAAVRQIYNVDHSFGQPPGWSLVYLVSTTDDSVMPDAPDIPSQHLQGALQEAITAELADQPFQVVWVDETEGAPIDPTNGQVADGDGIIISLGNIHAQDDGSVQLSFFMTCGGLCGIGKTYVLNQVGDAWQVTGSVGPEIMS